MLIKPARTAGPSCVQLIESHSNEAGKRTSTPNSTDKLTRATEAFVSHCNKTVAPLIWRMRKVKGYQLRN